MLIMVCWSWHQCVWYHWYLCRLVSVHHVIGALDLVVVDMNHLRQHVAHGVVTALEQCWTDFTAIVITYHCHAVLQSWSMSRFFAFRANFLSCSGGLSLLARLGSKGLKVRAQGQLWGTGVTLRLTWRFLILFVFCSGMTWSIGGSQVVMWPLQPCKVWSRFQSMHTFWVPLAFHLRQGRAGILLQCGEADVGDMTSVSRKECSRASRGLVGVLTGNRSFKPAVKSWGRHTPGIMTVEMQWHHMPDADWCISLEQDHHWQWLLTCQR